MVSGWPGMCRHLAWLGAPRSLASLVLEPPSSLLVQSYAPRRQRHGTVNADGWGTGWWATGRAEPARWRSASPLWGSASFASVAPAVSSSCVLAAVRSATVGMPVEASPRPLRSATAAGCCRTTAGWTARCCPGSRGGRRERLRQRPAGRTGFATGVDALGDVVRDVGARDPVARLNLLAADGTRLLATTWGDTLSVLETPGGHGAGQRALRRRPARPTFPTGTW